MRHATLDDLDAIVALKHALRWSDAAVGTGGFVLGAEVGEYVHWVQRGLVDVLDDSGRLVGFAVVFDDAEVRARGLAGRATQIQWCDEVPLALLDAKLAYFEQLAVADERKARLFAPALALSSLLRAMAAGHEHIFATTVRAPVTNRAAWSLLRAVQARCVGTLDEVHPAIGPLRSDVYWIDAVRARQALARLCARDSATLQSLEVLARRALP